MLTLKISALAIVAEKQLSTASTPGANVCPQNDQQSPADPEPEELDECLEEVAHVITCLYKFSIAIQNPAPLHRLQKSSLIDVSHFEPFDIQHVSNKFPHAEPYLVQRLGRSNTRRRQLLRYHERHHDKIAGRYGLESFVLAPEQGMSEGDHGRRDESARLKSKAEERSEHPQQASKKSSAANTLSATTVTAYQRPTEEHAFEQCSDTDFSQTSYSSSACGIVEKLRAPPPPNRESAFDGDAFQCPYCYIIITLAGHKSWK